MNYSKFSKIALTASVLFLGTANLASAAGSSNCEIVYGGGEVCPPQVKFTIDKKVQKPTKGGEFVDNLSVNDEKFNANQDVIFNVAVQNTGDSEASLTVTDILPSYLTYVSGGTFDSGNNKVNNNVTLKAGESKTYTIATRVVGASSLPASVTCVTNVARAVTSSGNSAEDTAQICIQNNVVVQPQIPSKSIPNTGPEVLVLFALPPIGAAGLYLRRKAGL